MENKPNSEKYFFKYAFPCSQVLLQMGKISQEEYDDLKKKFSEGKTPDRQTLERVFSAAFTRIKKLAQQMNKELWDFEVIHEYWSRNHNEMIKEGDGIYGKAPESFKDLCRINIAEITKKKGNMVFVKYDCNGKENKRMVFDILVPEAQVGDKVKIHYGYAIEKIDKKAKTQPELSKEVILAIEKARKRIREGNFVSEKEARKRLGF